MEDILASIRRIIADDQESASKDDPEDDPFEQAMADDEDEVSDDVLDLAEVGERVAPNTPDLELERDDISFLDADGQVDFDAIGEDEEPVADILDGQDAVDAAFANIGGEEEEEEEEELEEPFDEISFDPEPEPAFDPPSAQQHLLDENHLLSAATDAAVGSAFNTLAHTVLSNNGRTLDDLVKELLRPMLKTWLDDNLPTIVERLVRAEIERVSRGRR
ncbi:MAG: DUF2497 domain-containing protein [Salinarimonadaceae bacterium]|nr:MAG: DUF2497 domain-containing protein [Salinarimonadaceae bacterium]